MVQVVGHWEDFAILAGIALIALALLWAAMPDKAGRISGLARIVKLNLSETQFVRRHARACPRANGFSKMKMAPVRSHFHNTGLGMRVLLSGRSPVL